MPWASTMKWCPGGRGSVISARHGVNLDCRWRQRTVRLVGNPHHLLLPAGQDDRPT
jgi:hypothetical protein